MRGGKKPEENFDDHDFDFERRNFFRIVQIIPFNDTTA